MDLTFLECILGQNASGCIWNANGNPDSIIWLMYEWIPVPHLLLLLWVKSWSLTRPRDLTKATYIMLCPSAVFCQRKIPTSTTLGMWGKLSTSNPPSTQLQQYRWLWAFTTTSTSKRDRTKADEEQITRVGYTNSQSAMQPRSQSKEHVIGIQSISGHNNGKRPQTGSQPSKCHHLPKQLITNAGFDQMGIPIDSIFASWASGITNTNCHPGSSPRIHWTANRWSTFLTPLQHAALPPTKQ